MSTYRGTARQHPHIGSVAIQIKMENLGQGGGSNPPLTSAPSPLEKPIVTDGTLKESLAGSPSDTCLQARAPQTPSSQQQDTYAAPGSSMEGPQQLSRKLSPTASPFRPFLGTNQQSHRASGDPRHFAAIPCFFSTSRALSTDLGLSRRLIFTSTTGTLVVADVQGFLEVRSLLQ